MTNIKNLIDDLSTIDGKGEQEMDLASAKRLHPGDLVRIAKNVSTIIAYHTLYGKNNDVPKPGGVYKIINVIISNESVILRLCNKNTNLNKPEKDDLLIGDYGNSWIAAKVNGY